MKKEKDVVMLSDCGVCAVVLLLLLGEREMERDRKESGVLSSSGVES